MKYISKYNDISAFYDDRSNLSSDSLVAWVSDGTTAGKVIYIDDNKSSVYSKDVEEELDVTDYLSFTAFGEDSTISLHNEYNNAPKIYYSFDRTNWTKWDYSSISLVDGQTVYMYGDNPNGIGYQDKSTYDYVYSNFVMSGTIKASGNIQSLINKKCPSIVPGEYCFINLFEDCINLIQAPKLPAKKLSYYCYCQMFYNCTGLITAPELPSIVLADGCYSSIFSGCSNLINAPELPATNLAESCYNGMFRRCINLTMAPELPAKYIYKYSYRYMFQECSKLNYIKCSATSNITTTNLTNWLSGVPEIGDFYKDASTTYPSGVSGIPSGWTTHDIE